MTAHYRLLDLDIDVPRQRVSRGGQALDVSGLSFQLFAYLLAQDQRVVGFDEMIRAVWAPAVVGEETVTQRIKLLRQALGDDARRPRYLRSVRGQGYQLLELPEAIATPANRTAVPSRRMARWRKGGAALAIAVIFAAATGLVWHSFRAPVASPLLERAGYYAGIGQADNNDRAIALYRQALAQAPDSPAALAGLSRALSARTCLYNGGASEAGEGAALARRLLGHDRDSAAAWAALGYAQDCLGDMRRAVAGYEASVRLDPADDKSRASLAYLYQEQGRLADALHGNLTLRHPERARFRDVQVARELELLGFTAAAERRYRTNFELFPDNVFSNIAWPRFLLSQGRTEEAAAALKVALARGTPHPTLLRLQGELALLAGDRAAAIAAFAEGQRLRPHQSLPGTLAGLYAARPPTQEWIQSRLQDLQGDTFGWSDAALEAALLEQRRGDTDAALKALHAAVSAGLRDRAWLATTPLFADVRRVPGFAALLARIEGDVATQRMQVAQADWRPRELQ